MKRPNARHRSDVRYEGFYDTALNEASDAWTASDSTKANPRRQTWKVCRRPSVKTMLGDPGLSLAGFTQFTTIWFVDVEVLAVFP